VNREGRRRGFVRGKYELVDGVSQLFQGVKLAMRKY
jgi:hypothetical protein